MMGVAIFKNKVILEMVVDDDGNRRTSGQWTHLRGDYDKEATALVKLESKRTTFHALHRFIQL